ncbi:MAG: serine/threonine-protein kinase [Planctomycetaceae bacterium]|nr:serine/threonine-protein kinase [Planctomycetaceae bacterium]
MLQPNPESLFAAARDLAPAQRGSFLQSQCGDDADLRRHVEALLDADNDRGDLLDAVATTCDDPGLQSDFVGRQVGRYKLLQPIGEGGFGVVFMAEQQEPVRRRVALKIVKPGMDTRAVVARFEAERQALAMMEHPNIASVFDGGQIDGRPFFVMELVRGVPITEYCDTNALSTRERLALFVDVCDAVQHAHGKGIIHRDIKPANVMVTLHDGRPVVKVIDFGVAKAIHTRLTERTMFTAFGQMIGTPQYMSPEQAEMSGLDVDIRTDVYSMGVLLYELVTGTAPLSPVQLRKASLVEMQRLIREQEAMPPSQKLTTTGDQLLTIAGHRGVGPEALVRAVRGDLDWVVMKALDKDRQRRYETVREFSADVNSLLSGDAVIARPPSPLYRLSKFVRRYRAASAMVTVLLLAFVVSTLGMLRALQAEDEGQRRLQQLHQANGRLEDSRQRSDKLRADAQAAADLAKQQEQRARRMAQQSRSLRLAAEATRVVQSDPALSVTLGTMARETAVQPGSYHNSVLLAALENHYEQRTVDLKATRDRQMLTSTPTRCLTIGDDRVLVILDDTDVAAVAIDVNNGRELYRMSLPRLHIDTACVSPDQRHLATVSDAARYVTFRNGTRHSYTGRAVRIWSLADGTELLTLTGHDDRVESVDFSADGRQLASGSLDGSVRIWDITSGEQQQRLQLPEAFDQRPRSISDVSFSRSGRYVLAVVDGRTITAGYGLRRPGYVDDPLVAVDGDVISDELTGNARMEPRDTRTTAVVVWTVDDGALMFWHEFDHPDLVAGFAPVEQNGEHVAVTDLTAGSGQTEFRDPVTGASQGFLATSDFLNSVTATGARPVVVDGKLRVSRNHDDVAVFATFPRRAHQPQTRLKTSGLNGALMSEESDVLWRRMDQDRPVMLRGHRAKVVDVIPMGTRAVSIDESGILKVWDVGQPPLPPRLALPEQNQALLMACFAGPDCVVAAIGCQPRSASSDSRRFAFQSTSGYDAVHLWNPGTGYVQRLQPEPKFAKSQGLLSVLTDLVSPAAGRQLTGGLTTLDVHPGKQRLVTVHDDLHLVEQLRPPQQASPGYTPVRLWNLTTGKLEHELTGFRNSVSDAAFSHDGTRLAVFESDRFNMATAAGGHSGGNNRAWFGGVEIRDAQQGTLQRRLIRFEEQPADFRMLWHPRKSLLLCSYRLSGRTICEVFDAVTGEVATLPDRFAQARYSADGRYLVVSQGAELLLTEGPNSRMPPMTIAGEQPIVDFAFSADSQRVAIACQDGAMKIVRLADMHTINTRLSFDFSCQLQFSPDGRWVLVAETGAAEATLLDSRTGREWLRISCDRLQHAEFSPDSQFVITTDQNEVAEVWPVEPADAARRRPGRPLTEREQRQLSIGEFIDSVAASDSAKED